MAEQKQIDFDTLTDAIGCVRDRRTTAREQGDSEMEVHLNEVLDRLRNMRAPNIDRTPHRPS